MSKLVGQVLLFILILTLNKKLCWSVSLRMQTCKTKDKCTYQMGIM